MDGNELKERRHKLGLIRKQLGQLLGISEDAVYRWEIGRRRILPKRESAIEIIEAKFNQRKKGAYPKST